MAKLLKLKDETGAGFIVWIKSIISKSNSLTATRLLNKKTINGVGFDGTADITLNAIADVPWTGLTPSGGASDAGFKYRVKNDAMTISVRVILPAMTAGDIIQIGTIPTNYRPVSEFGQPGAVGMHGQVPTRLLFGADGRIRILCASTIPASQELNAVITYPIGG